MKDFAGKVAVVTGAASGIGRATATRFAEEGMKVVLADIEEPALDSVVGDLKSAGHEVIGVPTDVSKWEAIQTLADETIKNRQENTERSSGTLFLMEKWRNIFSVF